MKRLNLLPLFLLPLTCDLAFAQDTIAPDQAREVAWRFLTQAPHGPRPTLSLQEALRSRVVVDRGPVVPSERGVCVEVVLERSLAFDCKVRVNPRGDVIAYVCKAGAPDGMILAVLPERSLSKGERERQLRRRLLPREALRGRARAILSQLISGYRRRRFRVRGEALDVRGNLVEWILRLEEVAPPGVSAVYPNRISLSLNPETGDLTGFRQTAVPEVLEAPPAVTRERARALASREGPVEDIELLLMMRRGAPVPVWLAYTAEGRANVLLSATSGAPLTGGETGE